MAEGGAAIVMARVSLIGASGTTSSPGSGLVASSGSTPQRCHHGRTVNQRAAPPSVAVPATSATRLRHVRIKALPFRAPRGRVRAGRFTAGPPTRRRLDHGPSYGRADRANAPHSRAGAGPDHGPHGTGLAAPGAPATVPGCAR